MNDKVGIPLAFLLILVIWSTTPLAIQWSSVDGPFTSAFLRMAIGMLFTLTLLGFLKQQLPKDTAALRIYAFSGVAIFINMSLFYVAAQQIPSGWIAVLFGLSPLFTGLIDSFVEPDSKLTLSKSFGLSLGVAGLYLVFSAGLSLREASVLGVSLAVLATIISSASSVVTRQMVKSVNISGRQITAGSLLVAAPLFAISMLFLEPGTGFDMSQRALASTLYLGLIGSGIGFTLSFYLLQRVSASRLSLITLITPICGLSIGSLLNNEPILGEIWLGAALVCTGLLIYQFKPRLGLRRL